MDTTTDTAIAHEQAVTNWGITLWTNLNDDEAGWKVTRTRDTVTVTYEPNGMAIDFDIDGNGEPDITVWRQTFDPERGYYMWRPIMDGHWQTTGKDWPWLRTAIERALRLIA